MNKIILESMMVCFTKDSCKIVFSFFLLGDSVNDQRLFQASGNYAAGTELLSSGSELLILFQSNDYYNDRQTNSQQKWRAKWKAIDNSDLNRSSGDYSVDTYGSTNESSGSSSNRSSDSSSASTIFISLLSVILMIAIL